MTQSNLSHQDDWQSLMDEAYSQWQDKEDTEINSYDDMLEKSSDLTKYAIVLGNLNYQVHNGGFVQWVDNGYALQYPLVLEALRKTGLPLAIRTAELIETFSHLIDLDKDNRGFGHEYWNDAGYEVVGYEEEVEYDTGDVDEDGDPIYGYHYEWIEDEEYQESAGIGLCEVATNQFYEYSDEFEKVIGNWFSEQVKLQQSTEGKINDSPLSI